MRPIEGLYYDGKSSRPHPARLRALGKALHLEVGERDRGPVEPGAVQVSDRLAGVPRRLEFADGGVFETRDNAAIDAWLGARGWRGYDLLLHHVESHWRFVALSVLVLLAVGAWALLDGIPRASAAIAARLPDSAYTLVGRQSLSALERWLLAPSALEQPRQQALRAQFEALTAGLEWRPGLRVLFAGSDEGARANAFALPDGTILVTDALVRLAEDDRQILAVLAHETGHVLLRHGMRRLVQDSMLSFALVMITGDTTSVATSALALPTLLLELGYSRDFEREADTFAAELLSAHGLAPELLAQMLERLETGRGSRPSAGQGQPGVVDYLSTHPSTAERLRRLRNAATD